MSTRWLGVLQPVQTFDQFFSTILGHPPYPYQRRLADGPWPDLLSIPTGLGKTAAVLSAWLYRRLSGDVATPRRLVWCLPMRSLVEQTCDIADRMTAGVAPLFLQRGAEAPQVHRLMGGAADDAWTRVPDRPAILVGTQDMLLSRALMRGWGMSRYRWPVAFALLHSDALWVFDEVQLMGSALATSTQLEGLRRRLGTGLPARSLWMSATLQPDWLDTVDFADHLPELRVLGLADDDRRLGSGRLMAAKRVERAAAVPAGGTGKALTDYADALAAEVRAAHRPGSLTLAVVNTVARAQGLYRALAQHPPQDPAIDLGLIHSRFRAADRARQHERLLAPLPPAGRIVVATQAVEAGIDVSAATLVTELAPWASLVQRFGRCNRDGLQDGRILWADLPDELAAPYAAEELAVARGHLAGLTSAAPATLPAAVTPPEVRAVLRRRDLLDLFDTEPDLTGFDVDVAPFVRDAGPGDLRVFWRTLPDGFPEQGGDMVEEADRGELCPVSLSSFAPFLKSRPAGTAFSWDALLNRWVALAPRTSLRPGLVVLLDSRAGGYDPALGFTADQRGAVPVEPAAAAAPPESLDGDRRAEMRVAVPLSSHLRLCQSVAETLCADLAIDGPERAAVIRAARWHDVGKAHPAFQAAARATLPEGHPLAGDLLAKSMGRLAYGRRHFRHELASALAFRAIHGDTDGAGLVAYLIAAHHGKVRVAVRSLPDEAAEGRVRGIGDGDLLPPVDVAGIEAMGETVLSLAPLRLGGGWNDTAQRLLAGLGPFRLAWLEALVRIADWRASAAEQGEVP